MFEFKFPDVGEGITEGEIVKWRVKNGEKVKVDQVLVEVETDKAVVEIPSPKAGIILETKHKEGDIIKVGEVLVTIEEKGTKAEKVKVVRSKELKKDRPRSVGVVGQLEEAPEEHAKALPSVRRIARDLNVKLNEVAGSGKDGRITEEDVRKHKKNVKGVKVKVIPNYDFYGHVERVPLKGVRKSIANRMIQSYSKAVHVTHMDEVDITELVKIREKEKIGAEKKGVKLTYLAFIMKAVVAALKEMPILASSIDEEHHEIIVKKYYNMGFAVDTKDGLIVPVIKGVDQKNILSLAKEIKEFADKTRDRTIDISDLKGGVFTITNVGSLGGTYSTPIINFPEAAILAVGRISDKQVYSSSGVELRKILTLSLSFDHRILDGADAARFMNIIKKNLEDPDLLFVEIGS